jgi:hypothetical protein
MEVATAFLTITLPVVATVFLSNRQTQRILSEIKDVQQDTKRLLEKMHECLVKIGRTQSGMQRCLLKLDFGFEANACMHGWRREDGVPPKRVKQLPDPKIYNRKLRVCYYKAD